MKRKLSKLLLVTTMVLSLVGCTNSGGSEGAKGEETQKIIVASGNS